MSVKKKYVPNLRTFMAICTSNYAKLNKLLPELEKLQEEDDLAKILFNNQPPLEISLLQVSSHTQTLSFKQYDEIKHLDRNFCIRVYHDAQLVEVVSGVHDSMLLPVYKIPNSEMKQKDEKAQINQFLGEWLSFCLEHGIIDTEYKTHLAFLL